MQNARTSAEEANNSSHSSALVPLHKRSANGVRAIGEKVLGQMNWHQQQSTLFSPLFRWLAERKGRRTIKIIIYIIDYNISNKHDNNFLRMMKHIIIRQHL